MKPKSPIRMNYKTNCDTVEEILEWDNYIPSNATQLIIGTFPTAPHRRSFQFFYPNRDNPFWEVLAAIAKIKLLPVENSNAVQNRKSILTKLNLGITDMGKRVLRHANSSLDQRLFPVEFMNIFQILDNYPTIQKLILTSSSGENSVEGWLRSYCKLNSVRFKKLKGKNPKTGLLKHKVRELKVVSVHSTSRTAAKRLDDLIAMYQEELDRF
jgi:G:T/U-mismatch repair DNA glycosylase